MNVLLRIINTLLETGIFPENWKRFMIKLIEKLPKIRKCEEFRPINTFKSSRYNLNSFLNITVYYIDNNQVSERSIHVKLQ